MSRINDMFASLRKAGQEPRAIMARVCVGHPDRGSLASIVEGLELGGVGIAELVLPAPVLWGVPEQVAHAALATHARDVNLAHAVEQIAQARQRSSIGLTVCAAASCVFAGGGPAEFMERLAGAGVDGVWLPDVPLEEIAPFRQSAAQHGLDCALSIVPSTSVERAKRIAAACTGMVRLVVRAPSEAAARVARLREMTDLPIACECGADDAARVGEAARFADIIITDALISRLDAADAKAQDLGAVASDIASELSRAMRR